MDETLASAPITLDRSHMVLLPVELDLRPVDVGPEYWATAAERAELADGRVLSVFDYATDWTWWERHPLGDELFYCLIGGLVLLLDDGDRQWSADLSQGEAAIVPRGVWHSARVSKPCTALFVTPTPAMTEHRNVE
jgi:mannose-6-phosphate isomerase-like protein (cupin superfamily)